MTKTHPLSPNDLAADNAPMRLSDVRRMPLPVGFDLRLSTLTASARPRARLSRLELVESALRLLLRSQRKRQEIVALPTFHSDGAPVSGVFLQPMSVSARTALHTGHFFSGSVGV